MKLRKRHRLRRKEITSLADQLSEAFGCKVFGIEDTVDRAEASGGYEVVLVDGEAVAFVFEAKVALTVKGLLRYKPTNAFVEVDMGAIPFVIKGADVMAPGIVYADEGIGKGDLVWVRDQKNKRPLGVGEALMTGPEMISSKKGKAVKNLHYYGDAIWNLEP